VRLAAELLDVRAVAAAATADATPARPSWRVDAPPPPADTTPPETTIDSGPAGSTSATSATFAFSASEPGSTFLCSLDGSFSAPCTSGQTYTGLALGSHTFQVRATDPAGNVDATPATRTWTVEPPPPNLIGNGSFEASLDGWEGYHAALSLAADGVVGSGAARITLSEPATNFSMYPWPRPVTSTVGGAVYTARGWARSDTPGRTVCIRIREFAGGTAVGAALSCLTSTAAWQQFAPVAYTASASGNELEVYVYEWDAVAGDSFEVDGLELTSG
jgi:hypothetical protein